MNLTETSQLDELIERILQLTKSPQSAPFYRKAIQALGLGLVDSELGELRYRLHSGEVKDPAKYFTALLKKRLPAEQGGRWGKRSEELITPAVRDESQESFFSPSAGELFNELKPIPVQEADTSQERSLQKGFSRNTIPWVTFIGPDFFTMSTNKAKSDRVMAKFRTLDGSLCVIPMVRGKHSPTASEHGILTAEHGRVLGALENIWVQQGCNYKEFANGGVMCACRVSIRELARLLGWKSFSGPSLNRLRDKVTDLKLLPYYLELDAVEEFKRMGLKGYGFTLMGDVTVLDAKLQKKQETILKVMFSDTYSRQLLARRVVSRPKEMLTIRSELAFLLRLYLEPILMKKPEGEDHAIELNNLIEILNLPRAGWHDYKSQRKREFTKAIRELNGMTTIDGRVFDLRVEQGLNPDDSMLVSRLTPCIAPRSPQGALSTTN